MQVGNEPTLVAIIPRKKDWKILEEEHWYRIPVKSAPDIVTEIKYLAFYQPKIFDEEKYSVNYYAEVEDLEVVKRIKLFPDESKHVRANDDYYKFTIGELKRLPNPIPSRRWRRIVFIPTTLERLMNAKEINDLYHTSPIEEKLYEIMEEDEIPAERQLFVCEREQTYCLDFGIFCEEGKIDVECDGKAYHTSLEDREEDRLRNNELASYGWVVLRFTGAEINQDVKGCLKRIKSSIRSLKGIKDDIYENKS